MYVSIRRYRDVGDAAAFLNAIQLEFAPRLRRMPGFVAYYAFEAQDTAEITTVSVFSTAAMARESADAAAVWLRERGDGAGPEAVEITAGRMAFALPPIRG
jgi:hypothetical protein